MTIETQINVLPSALRSVLAGTMLPPPGVIYCETMLIGRTTSEGLVAIACPHACHGCHPRFVSRAAEKWLQRDNRSPTQCPVCSGRTLLPLDDPVARLYRVTALALGVFRGICLSPSEATR
jgi:hypothetical protein